MNAVVTSSSFFTLYSPVTRYKRQRIYFFPRGGSSKVHPEERRQCPHIIIIYYLTGHLSFFFRTTHGLDGSCHWLTCHQRLESSSTREPPCIMHGAFVTSRQFLNDAVVSVSHRNHPHNRVFAEVVPSQH